MSGSEREPVSRATLDGLCCEVLVDRARVLAWLQRAGAFDVEPPTGVGPELASVVCEVWQVTDGRSLFGGFDPLDVVEQWTALASSLFGLGAAPVRALSRALTLGPYRECLVAVPNVRVDGRRERHALVLGMITDNPIALSIDRSFGYGYRKRLGTFRFEDRRRFEVRVGQELVVSGEVTDEPASSGLPEPDRAWLADYWAQPLLGWHAPHDLRRSWLERRFEAADARAARVTSRVTLSPELGLGPDEDRFPVAARAVSFSGVPTRISLPRRLSRG